MRSARNLINGVDVEGIQTALSDMFRKMRGDSAEKNTANNTIETTNNDLSCPRQDSHLSADDQKGSAFRSAMTHLMCGIYALVLIVLGLVLPVSNALTVDTGTITYYVEVFQLYIYFASLCFLTYLHVYVLRQKTYEQHPHPRAIRLVSNNQLEVQDKPGLCLSDTGEIVHMPVGGVKENTGLRSRTPSSDLEMDGYQTPAPVALDSDGVSFYLRLGAIGFGTGSMIHDGFRIAQVLETNFDFTWTCYGPLFILVSIMHLIFTFFQTFFLFKSHKVVINMHKALVRFGLMHIVATNVCVWIATTVTETAEDYRHSMLVSTTPSDNTTTAAVATAKFGVFSTLTVNMSCVTRNSLARRTSPYLFPCTVEYSLIAAAVVYRMYRSVGRVGRHEVCQSIDDTPSYTDCHKANKGLFLGLFVTILTLIAVSSFFVFDEKVGGHEDMTSFIFYGTEMTLLFLSSIVVIVGFFKLQQLQFSANDEESFNAALLVISLSGLCMYGTFLVVSSIAKVDSRGLISILSLGTSALAFVQACAQAVFIMDGLRRSASCPEHVQKKPGRALVTFLLLCNLSLWVVNTFEISKTEAMPLHKNFYGNLPWGVISHICIPMLIFFRFHSSVCLSDIWVRAYTLKNKDM